MGSWFQLLKQTKIHTSASADLEKEEDHNVTTVRKYATSESAKGPISGEHPLTWPLSSTGSPARSTTSHAQSGIPMASPTLLFTSIRHLTCCLMPGQWSPDGCPPSCLSLSAPLGPVRKDTSVCQACPPTLVSQCGSAHNPWLIREIPYMRVEI